jgi:pyruvate kinase
MGDPAMNRGEEDRRLAHLARSLEELLASARDLEREVADEIARAAPEHRPSARNLAHYLALRRHDLRDLQQELAELGLSSLGRLEPHVLASVSAVDVVLRRLLGRTDASPLAAQDVPDFRLGTQRLADNATALLGAPRKGRGVRVMVTMPSEAAESPALIRDLVEAGMDVMRINCAHDDAATWRAMVANLRAAERALGRRCRVLCDLAGPKLRTGPLAPGPGVLHFWPLRDDAGRVLAPARLWLVPADGRAGADESGAHSGRSRLTLPIEAALFARLRAGDALHFLDVRGRHRILTITATSEGGAWAESDRTAYVGEGATLALHRDGAFLARGGVGALPPVEEPLRLAVGDRLLVTPDTVLGRSATPGESARTRGPARIGCTLPEAFEAVRPSDRIFFDDGRIGGVVRSVQPAGLEVEITQARAGRSKLRGDRGINLPDTEIHLPALTEKDREDLAFVIDHADLVGLSFVRSPADVDALVAELDARGADHLGVVLKIETRRAFDQLPGLLFAALRRPAMGVMVARGDLGVELGFSRLAEVQEEILWLCEAAHVPVIWATQVLESLAKRGMPSRAEVTDAAMGGRAECVMLNKGPHITEAVRFLCDVLARMEGHQEKKRSLLRRLGVSRGV